MWSGKTLDINFRVPYVCVQMHLHTHVSMHGEGQERGREHLWEDRREDERGRKGREGKRLARADLNRKDLGHYK